MSGNPRSRQGYGEYSWLPFWKKSVAGHRTTSVNDAKFERAWSCISIGSPIVELVPGSYPKIPQIRHLGIFKVVGRGPSSHRKHGCVRQLFLLKKYLYAGIVLRLLASPSCKFCNSAIVSSRSLSADLVACVAACCSLL